MTDLLSPGTILPMRLSDGSFGACQIVAELGGSWDVVALDWTGRKSPRAAQLRRAKPMMMTHPNGLGKVLARVVTHGMPPSGFDRIGSMKPTLQGPPPGNHGPWAWLVERVEAEAAWLRLPAAEVAKYEQCQRNGQTTWRYSVGHTPGCDAVVEAGAPFCWSSLDELGCLRELTVVGPVEGVFDYLTTRRMIRKLLWYEHDGAASDAGAVSLDTLLLDVPVGGMHLTVDDLRCLAIMNWAGAGAIEIDHPNQGAGLALELYSSSRTALSAALADLPQLSELSAWSLRYVDGRALAGYPGLRTVRLFGDRMTFVHLSALAELPQLERFELVDCYDFNPAELPSLEAFPRLQSAEFSGLRKTAAHAIKKSWAKLPQLTVRGVKGDAWLAANVDNPFNDWIDRHHPAAAKAACGAYRKSLGRLRKLKVNQKSLIAEEVKIFTDVFNRLPGDPSIDTLDAEEIWEALVQLVAAAKLEIGPRDLQRWFDQAREF